MNYRTLEEAGNEKKEIPPRSTCCKVLSIFRDTQTLSSAQLDMVDRFKGSTDAKQYVEHLLKIKQMRATKSLGVLRKCAILMSVLALAMFTAIATDTTEKGRAKVCERLTTVAFAIAEVMLMVAALKTSNRRCLTAIRNWLMFMGFIAFVMSGVDLLRSIDGIHAILKSQHNEQEMELKAYIYHQMFKRETFMYLVFGAIDAVQLMSVSYLAVLFAICVHRVLDFIRFISFDVITTEKKTVKITT